MFAALKSMPKLLWAKVEIMFLYYDHNDDDNETVSYYQAVIERISIKPKIPALDFMLSHCVMGVKRVPGIHHYDHVLMIEHLQVIKEGHSDVKWSQHQHPDTSFTKNWNRTQYLILDQVFLESDVSCHALQAFDQKSLFHHHQHDYGLASQALFTSLQKPLVQTHWTSCHFLTNDTTNLPSKKANL